LIKLKAGVTPRNLYIAAAVANVAQLMNIEVVITAGTDGRHMKNSKHYTGDALDIRSKDLSDKKRFLDLVLLRLGDGYQGFLESARTVNEHIHIEYDPK
jgi:hypothetical protein